MATLPSWRVWLSSAARQEVEIFRSGVAMGDSIKRNRDARLHVEPVSLIQRRDIIAVEGVRHTVLRHRQPHAPAGVLTGVSDGESVGRKEAALRGPGIEQPPYRRARWLNSRSHDGVPAVGTT